MIPYGLNEAGLPETVRRLGHTPPMLRLRQVGMNCGCEYTDFPRFRALAPYSRYEHSIGVAALIWRYTGSLRETVAGLFHDVATPVFAHTVDFLNGDYLVQESTEGPTERIIRGSAEILSLLEKTGLSVDEVKDYHRYPVADNDSPRLSCDRLEYTLGNLCNFGFRTPEEIRPYWEDLTVVKAEDGLPELAFLNRETALAFATDALKCSRIYISPEDRYAMQRLSEVLSLAIKKGVLTEAMLLLTEPEVIARLEADEETAAAWAAYRRLKHMLPAPEAADHPGRRRIPAKRRYIDPLVRGEGRLSEIDEGFCREKERFLATDLDTPVCGE